MAAQTPFDQRPERRGFVGPFSRGQVIGGAIAVIVAGVILVVVTTPLGKVGGPGPNDPAATPFILGPAPTNGLRVGDIPPELTITDAAGNAAPLTDLQGHPVQLADLKGKAVWVNFWASWCPPCQSETPVLRDLADAYRARGLAVVGISVQETSPDNVAAYATRYQLQYTVAADSTGQIFRTYRLYALPTQFFIGPEGAIRAIVPAPMTVATASALIESILPPLPSGLASSPGSWPVGSPGPIPSASGH